MNLKLFETFVAVAQLRSFRAAAEHLNSTQPAISMRIRELERALGIKLFERAHRSSILTAKGQELLPLAEQLLGVAGEIQQHVADSKMITETVRVGLSELIALTWLTDLTAEIDRRFPNVSLRFDVDLVHGLIGKLRARELDLVLCAGPLKEPDLRSVSLGTVKLDWFGGPQLDLPADRLEASDLARHPLISLSPSSSLHAMAVEWLRANGASWRRTNFCNSMHTVSLLIRSGQGLSILPTAYYEPHVASGEMRILKPKPALPSLEYVAVYFQSRSSPLIPVVAEIAAKTSGFGREAGGAKAHARSSRAFPARRRSRRSR